MAAHGEDTISAWARRREVAVGGAATIDRMLGDVKVAAAGSRGRRAGFYSAIRREVPIRTFNDWKDPAPGFCEVDMVAHGGTSVAGSFIQTLTMVDVATEWTECLPLVNRDGNLVVEAIKRAQSLFPWLLRRCRLRPQPHRARTNFFSISWQFWPTKAPVDLGFRPWIGFDCPKVIDTMVLVKPATVVEWHRKGSFTPVA